MVGIVITNNFALILGNLIIFLFTLPVKFDVCSPISDFLVSLLLLVVDLAEIFWWLVKPPLPDEKII